MARLELTVHEEVVYGAAIWVAHHAVEHLSGLESADFVGEDVVHEGFGIRAFNKDLSHVGDIEHAHVLPYGKVLRHYAGILDGHNEACEGTHLGA